MDHTVIMVVYFSMGILQICGTGKVCMCVYIYITLGEYIFGDDVKRTRKTRFRMSPGGNRHNAFETSWWRHTSPKTTRSVR